MDVTGKGFPISGQTRNYGALLLWSVSTGASTGVRYPGLKVFIFDDGRLLYRLRDDKPFWLENALPNMEQQITRHLVFSRIGNIFKAVIDGSEHVGKITKEIEDADVALIKQTFLVPV